MLLRNTLFLLALTATTVANAADAYSRVFGPRTDIKIAKPTVRWEVWPATGGKVTDKKMTINGRVVEAVYDARQRALLYTPKTPLAPGEYRVQCRVVIDDSLVANKEWTFTVSAGAWASLPTPNADQGRALDAANQFRRLLGLDEFGFDSRMNAAAQAHSMYLAQNNVTGHYQKAGTQGFFGNTPGERLEAYGYFDESWECVDYGSRDPEAAVQSLIDAPYHRLPFLQPGPITVGTGYHGRRLTMEFSGTQQDGTVVHPAPGQTGVPVLWDANERPNPLRLHDLPRPVGYIVVFTVWTKNNADIRIEEATLRNCADGSTVNVALNTPENDEHLSNACFIIPRRPLKAGTTYEAFVRAKVVPSDKRGVGPAVERRWRFTTAAR